MNYQQVMQMLNTVQPPAETPVPAELPTFFGFQGNPATIAIGKADGVYVEGVKVEPKAE